jgi:hypothetical protein
MSHRQETFSAQLTSEAMRNGQPTEAILNQIEMAALAEGVNFAFLLSAILLLIALVLAFFMKRATQVEDPSKKETEIPVVETV